MQHNKDLHSEQLIFTLAAQVDELAPGHALNSQPPMRPLQSEFPRDQLTVPIAPSEEVDESTLFEAPSGARQYYLPHYVVQTRLVSGSPRYEIVFVRDTDRWQLRISLGKSMSDSIFARAPDALEIPHTPVLILRYRFTSDNNAMREIRMSEVLVVGDGITAVLNIETLGLRDEIHRALTELSLGAQLVIERQLRMAVLSQQPGGATGPLADVVMNGSTASLISLVKVIRAFTGLGLKQSKLLAETPPPVVLQKGLEPTIAAKFLRALRRIGVDAVLRPQSTINAFQPMSKALLIKLLAQREREIRGRKFIQYTIAVSNWQTVDDSLFQPAEDLPPCGANTRSSRSWVDIIGLTRRSKKRIYGYCALTSARDLTKLSFNVPVESQPEAVVLVLDDRRTGEKRLSQALKLRRSLVTTPPPRTTRPPSPPPGPPMYRVMDAVSLQTVLPSPFVFDPSLHDYIFDFVKGDNIPLTGLIRVQKPYQGGFHSYYQDAARRQVMYYLPDAFKLARKMQAPHFPEVSVSIRSTDGAQENTLVSMDYMVKPYIDTARIEQAKMQLATEIGQGLEVDLQPFPLDEFRFFISYIASDGLITLERNGMAGVLREGIRDTLQLSLAEFVPLFASMAGAGAGGLSGNIEIDIPGIGTHDIPLIALFEDLLGPTVISRAQAGEQPGDFDVVISNAIESPIMLEHIHARLETGAGIINPEIEPGLVPALLQPDDSLIFSLSAGPLVDEQDARTLELDLSPIQVLPDQALIWNVIANRSATEFFRLITVLVSEVIFQLNPERPERQILKILVHFEGGDSVELNQQQLQSDARVDYPVDDVVLGRVQDPAYRYSFDVIRADGLDPRSEILTDRVELLPLGVAR